ncbi:uncharacterized protein [Musca autumnalis]|uniref:uncharacterized protein n=1 Tax=Musca autumnalis TaxID=221902 RepID=UPI003CF297CC
MNMTEDAVKKKIKSLRSTYVLEKKKVEQSKRSGCDAADVYEPTLCWYAEMNFLDNHISARKSINNITNNISDSSVFSEESENILEPKITISSSTPHKKIKHEVNTDKFDEAIEKIVNLSKPLNDPYSAFGEYIAMTLRTMSEDGDYLTMKKIQDLVFHQKCKNGDNGRTTESQSYKVSQEETDSTGMFDVEFLLDSSEE